MLIILTAASMLLALIMSVVAWRTSRAERRRSEARIESLARDIHQPPVVDELPLRPGPGPVEPARSAGDLFAATSQPVASGSRWGLALAVGAFVVASAAAMIVVFGGDAPGTRIAIASGSEQAPAPQPRRLGPLELIALSQERDGNQLTVRGIVRNPAAGTEMDRLTAVVVLFNQDGNAVATNRTPVASAALIPGGESTFAVTIADAADVARYRVSFRSDEHVVPHVDKRIAP
jgi:hypothetical protein